MSRFVRYANLPEREVTDVIVSDQCPDICRELTEQYHARQWVPAPIRDISGAERFHADMSVCHLGKNQFVLDEHNHALGRMLAGEGAIIRYSEPVTAARPVLNVCLLRDRLICREIMTEPFVLEECEKKGMTLFDTAQRYAKCSCAVVNADSVITSDPSIEKCCRKAGMNVLRIRSGYIRLPGYAYGFIGGCCGLLSERLLGFSGDIRRHPDYDNIRDFAGNVQVEVVSLGTGILYDIGGILPIMERDDEKNEGGQN